MMDEFNTADATTDTGGSDVIDTMYEWIAHEQPKERFDSVTQYMMYRWNDSAFKYAASFQVETGYGSRANNDRWICACVKFSIASDVDLNDARLATFMHLAGNHFSLVNDLASFEKETQEFQSGEAAFVINVVDVLQRQHGIDVREAKAKAYSMQLEMENHIEEDLEQLKKRDLLSLEEWRFVNAVVVMLGGHVFYCMTASRYGGEKSRIT
ncbi:hypothetical protein Plec18167_008071 [Paecilomyces lecythidis]|uniref:Isoprenoid synthase domain-containing protein n=1 Tax=Paecilomyces lecythidis TaxID=3004212 RepID=A0ABR3WZ89_9EURO